MVMTHFLQSPAWATFQEALGRTVVRDHGDGWSYQAIVESGTLNTRLYTPYGPACTSEESFNAALASLTSYATAHKLTFVRVEPTTDITPDQLATRGLRPVTYQQLQPAHTQVIDLSPTPDELLAGMSQNSRNITRNYHKKGVTIHTSHDPSDIHILTDLLAPVATRNHIQTHSVEYFRAQAETLFPAQSATLYYASVNTTPIAAALVYDSGTTRYYAHAAANDEYRKFSAGTALVGQMMLDAKEKGLTSFDLYGIAPSDDPTHPWAGFTKFKKSFGGQGVTYVGAWDLPLRPVQYRLYRAYQSLRRQMRR